MTDGITPPHPAWVAALMAYEAHLTDPSITRAGTAAAMAELYEKDVLAALRSADGTVLVGLDDEDVSYDAAQWIFDVVGDALLLYGQP